MIAQYPTTVGCHLLELASTKVECYAVINRAYLHLLSVMSYAWWHRGGVLTFQTVSGHGALLEALLAMAGLMSYKAATHLSLSELLPNQNKAVLSTCASLSSNIILTVALWC